MTIDRFEETVMHGVPVFTYRQRRAADFLEARGKRFLYEYGFQNCESMAEDMGWSYAPLAFEMRPNRHHTGWRSA